MPKLLLDSQPLMVLPELAAVIGLNESLVLQQIHYWLEINKKADRNFCDGHHWTYNSYESWKEQFPFWGVKRIRLIFKQLKSLGLIVAANFNRAGFDKTLWYRIDYNALSELVSGIGRDTGVRSIGTQGSDRQPCGFAGGATEKVRSFQEFAEDRKSPFSSTAEEDHKRIKELGF